MSPRRWRALLFVALAAAAWGCAVVEPTGELGDRIDDIFRDDRLQDLSG